MKACFLIRPGKIELLKTKIPKTSEGELLVKIKAALTCGTDLKAFSRGHHVIPMPGVFGHEFSGIVADAGKGVRKFKKGDEIMGGRVRVKVVKNKVDAPFKQTEFDLMYNEGISREGEIIALGEKMGIVQKSGNSYKYLPAGASAKEGGEITLGRGYDATRQFLKDKANKKIAEEILKLIRKKLIENAGSIVPVKEGSEEKENLEE